MAPPLQGARWRIIEVLEDAGFIRSACCNTRQPIMFVKAVPCADAVVVLRDLINVQSHFVLSADFPSYK